MTGTFPRLVIQYMLQPTWNHRNTFLQHARNMHFGLASEESNSFAIYPSELKIRKRSPTMETRWARSLRRIDIISSTRHPTFALLVFNFCVPFLSLPLIPFLKLVIPAKRDNSYFQQIMIKIGGRFRFVTNGITRDNCRRNGGSGTLSKAYCVW